MHGRERHASRGPGCKADERPPLLFLVGVCNESVASVRHRGYGCRAAILRELTG